jgi:class 3 adenylate cyclase/lipopolysaccharide biosynthesis regulator YciM
MENTQVLPEYQAIERIDDLNERAWSAFQHPTGKQLAGEALLQSQELHYRNGEAGAICALAKASYLAGEWDAAHQYALQSLELAQELDNVKVKARSLEMLGHYHGSQSDLQQAISYYKNAIALYEEIGDKVGLARLLANTGGELREIGEISEAIEYQMRSMAICEETGSIAGLARACTNLGIIYHSIGEEETAISYHRRALVYDEQTGDRRRIGGSFVNLANIYNQLGEYGTGIEYLFRAIDVFEEINEKPFYAVALNNIGNTYYLMGDHQKALEYYNRVLPMWHESGNKRHISGLSINIAAIHIALKEYDKALPLLTQAITILEEIGEKDFLANGLTQLCDVYTHLGQYDDALSVLQRSLTLKEDISDRGGIITTLTEIGELYSNERFSRYNPELAVEYFLRALNLSEETGAKHLLQRAEESLSALYEKLEDWKNFSIHFKKSVALKEEILGDQNAKRIQEMELERKNAESEKEREVTERLLLKILPAPIAQRLKNSEKISDKISSATVLFADIAGFTPLTQKLGSEQIIDLLSGIFSHFDALCEKFGVEKIKTVGDSYMAAAGVPIECDDHLLKVAKLAIAMQEDIRLNLDFKIPELSIRIGIHTGEVIAGVLGTQKLSYDIWGDTVNTAARMESHGDPDTIHCTESVYQLLKDKFLFKKRGEMEIKGKGKMKTYFLLKEK